MHVSASREGPTIAMSGFRALYSSIEASGTALQEEEYPSLASFSSKSEKTLGFVSMIRIFKSVSMATCE